MKSTKQIDKMLQDNDKQLSKLFKYDKKKALTFSKEDREEVADKYGVFVIFDNKTPIFVGQSGGYSTGYQPITRDLAYKLGQFNLKSGVGTAKFKKGLAATKTLDVTDTSLITAEALNLKFQYINVKNEPAFINILEFLAIEYAKNKGYHLINYYDINLD